jgi:hypothetical protein
MADAGASPPVADTDEKDVPKKAIWPLLLQGALLYLMWQWRSASKAASSSTTTPPPVVDTDSTTSGGAGVVISDEWVLSASPTPTSVAATGPFAEFSKMMDHVKDATSGKRKVAPELEAMEEARQLALARAQRSGAGGEGATLANAWASGALFDITIFLAESAVPLIDYSFVNIAVVAAGAGSSSSSDVLDNSTFFGLAEAEEKAEKKALATAVAKNSEEMLMTTPPPPPPPPFAAFWRQESLSYSGSQATRTQHFNISLPPSVLANTSRVYAHVFFSLTGSPIDPTAPNYQRAHVIRAVIPLIKFLKRKPVKPRFSLMSGDDDGDGNGENGTSSKKSSTTHRYGIASSKAELKELDAQRAAKKKAAAVNADDDYSGVVDNNNNVDNNDGHGAVTAAILAYWKPTLHLQLVDDRALLSAQALPPGIPSVIDVVVTPEGKFAYTPHFYSNEFWLLSHHLVAVNASTPIVPLTVSYSPVAMWRWAIEAQMTQSWEMQTAIGTSAESDTDMIKSILVDTNPILLSITVVVSVLHSVFDFLAFRNDISFWRAAKNLEGLSVRTVAMSVFFQGVIFLYLLDFGETSYMVLFSTGAGVAIEGWKLLRAMGGKIGWKGWVPQIDWGTQAISYAVSKTQEYDAIATSHLLFILYPLIVGYAGFSLFNDRHRSWYSWILSSLVSFIYMFGFAQMVPQLYINYRLKSVAHLPWKTMSYKFLNTIIDDLFAFVVKMPSESPSRLLRTLNLVSQTIFSHTITVLVLKLFFTLTFSPPHPPIPL